MAIQAVTAGRHNQKRWIRRTQKGVRLAGALYGIKVYEAQPRKDGTFVWRLVRIERETFSVLGTVIQAAHKYAKQHNLPYLPQLRHGDRMNQVIQ